MKASTLLKFLNDMKAQGVNLNKVDVLYRHDSNSDEVNVKHVSEDLYDPVTNNIPITIMLSTRKLGC
jgi:hypothetical protein